ncbi:hypothetical protein GCM10019016_000650 [Streptomyces prasinosporus]|uniref:Uncharacterized protein n=1 Tax=Streptomyces prasinosporus TaxID=68256 RepID=A0ABP6TCP7_9ACTN|nr:hypothetical protein GCM10010332_41860 [Streptomyces albogriseolus]
MVAEPFEQFMIHPQAEHVGPHAHESRRTSRRGAWHFAHRSLIWVISAPAGRPLGREWRDSRAGAAYRVVFSESNELR